MSKATSTILNYDDDELLKFVDRRVGGPDHSPIWDLYEKNDFDFFRNRGRRAVVSNSSAGRRSPAQSSAGGGSVASAKARTAITAKHGQAVVKVISYGRGKASAKSQMEYISRKGELALEDRDGLQIEGSEDIAELANDWSASFDDKANSRNVVHLMLSAPVGTDREAAHGSVRDFAQNVFADNHDYVLARHDDTDHPHTHIVVKMRGDNGQKLDPRKAELRFWREEYARCAAVHGIKLDASPRRHRGQGKRGQKMAVVKLKERGEHSYAEIATARELVADPTATHPSEEAAQTAFEEERREFAELGLALRKLMERGGEAGDRAAALFSRVHEYTVSMTPPESLRAEMREIVGETGTQSAEELVKSHDEQKEAENVENQDKAPERPPTEPRGR